MVTHSITIVKPFNLVALKVEDFKCKIILALHFGKCKPHSSNATYYRNYSGYSIDIRTL